MLEAKRPYKSSVVKSQNPRGIITGSPNIVRPPLADFRFSFFPHNFFNDNTQVRSRCQSVRSGGCACVVVCPAYVSSGAAFVVHAFAGRFERFRLF